MALANTAVQSLVASGSNLFAGTRGSGVWRATIPELTGVNNYNPSLRSSLQEGLNIVAPGHNSPSVAVAFSLPQVSQVRVVIYDLFGHVITTLVNKKLVVGSYRLTWDTRNVAAGCYTIRMQTGFNSIVKNIVISR